jgi:uncharacterized protein (DUF3084 family)
MEDGFVQFQTLFVQVQDSFHTIMRRLQQDVQTVTSDYNESSDQGSSIEARLKALEHASTRLQAGHLHASEKMKALGQALKDLATQDLALMSRNREFTRHMICYLNRNYRFDPNTPGSSLISNLFVPV